MMLSFTTIPRDIWRNRARGFTLLEGIIAITVISIGLVAALSLALSNLSSSEANEKRIVGANLAREGIELVRNQRDTNWLKVDLNEPVTWDTFLDSNGQPVGTFFRPVTDQTLDANGLVTAVGHTWSTIQTPDLMAMPGTCDEQDCIDACGSACQVYYDQTSHVYGLAATATPVPTLTQFRRLLTRQDICYNDPTNTESIAALGASCSGSETKIGFLVTSIVRFDPAHKQDVIIKERLYNWR